MRKNEMWLKVETYSLLKNKENFVENNLYLVERK